MPRKTRRTSTAKVRSHSSASMWVIGPKAPATPALLKTQSSRPKASGAAAMAAATSASRVTSARTKADAVGVTGRCAPAPRSPRPLALVDVGDHHRRALGEKAQRDRAPDAVAAAGDHRHLAVEPSRHARRPPSQRAMLPCGLSWHEARVASSATDCARQANSTHGARTCERGESPTQRSRRVVPSVTRSRSCATSCSSACAICAPSGARRSSR